MNIGSCPFAAQGQSESAATCPLGSGSAPAPGQPSPSSTSPALTCPLGFGGGRGANTTEKRPTAASFASTGLPRMPLAVLAAHPTLVAVKGVVFDVSDVEAYQKRLAAWTGHDASRAIALSGGAGAGAGAGAGVGGGEGLDEGLSGLKYEEHQRLEAYFLEMARSRKAVAALTDDDHARIFGAPLGAGGGGGTYSPAAATLAPKAKTDTSDRGHVDAASPPPALALAAELHAAVEQGDAAAVARVLSLSLSNDDDDHHHHHQQPDGDGASLAPGRRDDYNTEQPQRRELPSPSPSPHLVDCACPRTGLTPLLKAVEGGLEEVVRVLLDAGGDVRSQAVLYDGDDALALAKRLGCSDAIVEMIQRAQT